MKLKIADRINLVNILPKQDTTFEKLIISKEIDEKIRITGKEVKKYNIKQEEGSITWNEKGINDEVDFNLSEAECNLIKECLKELNEKNKMSYSLMDLYKIFVK